MCVCVCVFAEVSVCVCVFVCVSVSEETTVTNTNLEHMVAITKREEAPGQKVGVVCLSLEMGRARLLT